LIAKHRKTVNTPSPHLLRVGAVLARLGGRDIRRKNRAKGVLGKNSLIFGINNVYFTKKPLDKWQYIALL